MTGHHGGDSPIRIASWPFAGTNHYIELFYRALEPYGVRLIRGLRIEDAFLRDHAGEFDAIHIQWIPEDMWRGRGIGVAGRLYGVAGLWRYLALAKSLGLRILWTVHDIEHLEGGGLADRCGYRLLARCADLCICHSEWCRQQLLDRYGGRASATFVIPIGNYDGVFPPPQDRQNTLARLRLHEGRRTLLCHGLVRPYKGFDLAIEAVGRLGPDYQLIVAGNPQDSWWRERLRTLAAGSPNVALVLERLDDQTISDLADLADCFLLPYRHITGSGALLTALTFERGVVASDLPYFRETLSPEPEAGVLFAPGHVEALAAASRAFFAIPLNRRCAASRRLADRYAWTQAITPIARWLQREFSLGFASAGAVNG